MLRTYEGNYVFSEKKIRFVSTLDLIECRKQIKLQKFLLKCAPISELPSNIANQDCLLENILAHHTENRGKLKKNPSDKFKTAVYSGLAENPLWHEQVRSTGKSVFVRMCREGRLYITWYLVKTKKL